MSNIKYYTRVVWLPILIMLDSFVDIDILPSWKAGPLPTI